ncbi:MAG: Smr/MutS family protein [Desulfurellaceae bacterium]|nr:Smr/MutS family protein [Desulfurellaceae bacterium]
MIKTLRRVWRALRSPAPRAEPAAASAEDEQEPAWSEPDEPLVVPLEDVIDLHPFAPQEIRSVVEEYLLACCQAGLSPVRLIHGKGKGVQRNSIRALLARLPYVEEFHDAPPQAGGWGATVVRLKPTDQHRT